MNIEKYKTFLVCAESRTFQSAAEALSVAPATVTKHIASLEKELGCTLFERTPKGLLLTDEGQERLPMVRQIVAAYDSLLLITNDEPQEEALKIYSIPIFDRYRLRDMLEEFSRKYPDIEFSVSEEREVYRRLTEHEVQIAFMFQKELDTELYDVISFPVGKIGIMVKKTHPWAKYDTISIQRLKNIRLVCKLYSKTRESFAPYFEDSGFTPTIKSLLNREDVVMLDVRSNDSVALFTSDVFDVFKPDDLAFIPFEESYFSMGQLVRLKNVNLSEKADTFWRFAESWLREHRGAWTSYKTLRKEKYDL